MPPTTESCTSAPVSTALYSYRSSRPTQQLRFPSRRKVVRTYGERRLVRSPKQQTLTQIGHMGLPVSGLQHFIFGEEDKQQHNLADGWEEDHAIHDTSSGLSNNSPQIHAMSQSISSELSAREYGHDVDGVFRVSVIQDSQDIDESDSPQTKSTDAKDGRTNSAVLLSPLEPRTPSPLKHLGQENDRSKALRTPQAWQMEIPSSQPSPFTPCQTRPSPLHLDRRRNSVLGRKIDATSNSQDIYEQQPIPGLQSLKRRRSGSDRSESCLSLESPSRGRSETYNANGSQSPLRHLRSLEMAKRSCRLASTSSAHILREPPLRKPADHASGMSSSEIPDTDEEDELYSLESVSPNLAKTPTAEDVDDKEDDAHGFFPIPDWESASQAVVATTLDCSLQDMSDSREQRSRCWSNGGKERAVCSVPAHVTDSASIQRHGSPEEARLFMRSEAYEEHSGATSISDDEIMPPGRSSNTQATFLATTNCRTESQAAETQLQQSQSLESQRVPLEAIRVLGPQTDRSDIIISIHPEQVRKIVDGTKDHEFRNYKIPQTVTRFWIYVTRPVCELRFMAVVGAGFRQPGEIDSHSGVGNRDFNANRMAAKFAYRLTQVYQLNNPVSLDVMKRNGWVDGPPQRYTYVPPAVVGALLANLRCALFGDDQGGRSGDGDSSSRSTRGIRKRQTISQEIEAQLLGDMSDTQLLQTEQLMSHRLSNGAPLLLQKSTIGSEKTETSYEDDSISTEGKNNQAATHASSRSGGIGYNRPSQATTASSPSSQRVLAGGLLEARLETQDSSQPTCVPAPVTRPVLDSCMSKVVKSENIFRGKAGEDAQLKRPVPNSDAVPASRRAYQQQQMRRQPCQRTQHRSPQQAIPSSSTDSTQIILPDSLYEEVRQAPPVVILDSEDSEDEH